MTLHDNDRPECTWKASRSTCNGRHSKASNLLSAATIHVDLNSGRYCTAAQKLVASHRQQWCHLVSTFVPRAMSAGLVGPFKPWNPRSSKMHLHSCCRVHHIFVLLVAYSFLTRRTLCSWPWTTIQRSWKLDQATYWPIVPLLVGIV